MAKKTDKPIDMSALGVHVGRSLKVYLKREPDTTGTREALYRHVAGTMTREKLSDSFVFAVAKVLFPRRTFATQKLAIAAIVAKAPATLPPIEPKQKPKGVGKRPATPKARKSRYIEPARFSPF